MRKQGMVYEEVIVSMSIKMNCASSVINCA